MTNQERNPSDELRDRFIEELRKPLGQRYFAEEDLVHIIDTAGDANDDYLRQEALLLGAHLYPDSDRLLERRAIFYFDTDDDVFERFMSDNAETDTPLFAILRLNLLSGKPQKEIVTAIEDFLSTHRFEEDEEVIRFVDTLHHLKCDRWLVDNLDRLKAAVPYVPSLLYEIGMLADESSEIAGIAPKVMEELTELEPYVADYWTLLALAHLRFDDTEEAAAAIEYALAIDPDNYHALKVKLHTANSRGDVATFDVTLKKILEFGLFDPDLIALILMGPGADDMASMHARIDSLPSSLQATQTVINHAITTGYPRVAKLLEDYFDAGNTDADDWRELADTAYAYGNNAAINDILRTFEAKSGEPLDHEYLIFRILFDLKNYALAAKLYTEATEGSTLRRHDVLYTSYSIFVLSLLRMGDVQSAKNAAESMRGILLDSETNMIGSNVEQRAMLYFVEDVLKRLRSKRKTDWEKISPLV